ncbi:hypothetical protein My1_085 [Pectobacterium phage My1]|uniref:Cyclic-phosphate processing Receiver domain-containing protein n=1 Tax=Pectobacterium phage My1 TaxID=1204539 RepID=J9QKZ7_9CAUD|nr:hypothetical protein My1_085 [Pectobacterium phage My1]AFQ22244.1 hypothetical protein My1_085 [Pectobacterium phage My1]
MLHILFDDVRNLEGMDIIARTTEAMHSLIELHLIKGCYLYMDNDLGASEEGYDILTTILTKTDNRPAYVHLVTSNPVARIRMQQLLEAEGYTAYIGGVTWENNLN